MNDRVHFNGSPTVDGYYTTFDTSEVHRIDEGRSDEGGGSSDFSTATLTVTRGEDLDGRMYIPNLEASPIGTSLFPLLPGAVGTNTYEIVVYSGGTVLIYDGTYTATVDGDIQAMGGGTYLITGDCAITFA